MKEVPSRAANGTLPMLPAGVWRHYKSREYLVLGYGHDNNHAEREVVVYVPLYVDPTHIGPRLAIRSVSDFFAKICTLEECPFYGSIETDASGGCLRCKSPMNPRFRYLAPEWLPDMGANTD